MHFRGENQPRLSKAKLIRNTRFRETQHQPGLRMTPCSRRKKGWELNGTTRWRSSSSGCAPLQRASLSCLQCHRNCLRKKGCTAGGTHVTTARKRYKDSRGCDDAWAKDLAEKQYHNRCFLRAETISTQCFVRTGFPENR